MSKLKQSSTTLRLSTTRANPNPAAHPNSNQEHYVPRRKRAWHHKHQRRHQTHHHNQVQHHPPLNDLYQWPNSPHPTPYQILNLPPTSPYRSKSRFHELVKLYHPDRHQHTTHHTIPLYTKLDRYRLVVLAHSILNNTTRRRLYDHSGLGWTLAPHSHSHSHSHSHPSSSSSMDDAQRGRGPDGKPLSWRDQPGSAANNATWEDWERWYQQRDEAATANASRSNGDGGSKKTRMVEPRFMSNGLFAMFVVMATMGAAIGQFVWAENHAKKILMLKDLNHDRIVRELDVQRLNSAGINDADARIRAFLERRDGAYYVPPQTTRTP